MVYIRKAAVMKTLPKNEKLCLTYKIENKNQFVITFNAIKQIYTIYKVLNDGYEKLGTGNNPLKLEEKFIHKGELKNGYELARKGN